VVDGRMLGELVNHRPRSFIRKAAVFRRKVLSFTVCQAFSLRPEAGTQQRVNLELLHIMRNGHREF